jgi:SM-20-related protein
MEGSGIPQTPIVIFDEFLAAQEWRSLVDYTLSHEPEFTQTQVIGGEGEGRVDHQYRRSRVLYDLGPFHQLFTDRLMTFLPHALARLNFPPFPVSHMEIQLTGTNNSEFFRMHSDNDAGQVTGRTLTFVYFFHREPLGFAGGELKIHDTIRNNGQVTANGVHRLVYPLQNQVILFDSRNLHEIQPVRCDSDEFADSRFTVNGWFHR